MPTKENTNSNQQLTSEEIEGLKDQIKSYQENYKSKRKEIDEKERDYTTARNDLQEQERARADAVRRAEQLDVDIVQKRNEVETKEQQLNQAKEALEEIDPKLSTRTAKRQRSRVAEKERDYTTARNDLQEQERARADAVRRAEQLDVDIVQKRNEVETKEQQFNQARNDLKNNNRSTIESSTKINNSLRINLINSMSGLWKEISVTAYGIITLIGIIYLSTYYSVFRIDIWSYAEITDFFLSGFKSVLEIYPALIILMLLYFILIFIGTTTITNKILEIKYIPYKISSILYLLFSKMGNTSRAIFESPILSISVMTIIVLMTSFYKAVTNANYVKNTEYNYEKIIANVITSPPLKDINEVVKIGNTSRYIFFVNTSSKDENGVIIIPTSKIHCIDFYDNTSTKCKSSNNINSFFNSLNKILPLEIYNNNNDFFNSIENSLFNLEYLKNINSKIEEIPHTLSDIKKTLAQAFNRSTPVWVGHRAPLLTFAFTFDHENDSREKGTDLSLAQQEELRKLVLDLTACHDDNGRGAHGGDTTHEDQVWLHVVGFASSSPWRGAAKSIKSRIKNIETANQRAENVKDFISKTYESMESNKSNPETANQRANNVEFFLKTANESAEKVYFELDRLSQNVDSKKRLKITMRRWQKDQQDDYELMQHGREFNDTPDQEYNAKRGRLTRRVEVRLLQAGDCAGNATIRSRGLLVHSHREG